MSEPTAQQHSVNASLGVTEATWRAHRIRVTLMFGVTELSEA